MPIAYSYDAETRIYNGEIERQLDPLESEKAGYEIWLMPAYATDVPPLEPMEGYNVVWEDGFWSYVEIPQPPAPPEPEPPTPPTKEEQEQARKAAYTDEIDPLHARKMRKTILGEWTEEDETEYLEQVRTLSAEIIERYPYPTDPII